MQRNRQTLYRRTYALMSAIKRLLCRLSLWEWRIKCEDVKLISFTFTHSWLLAFVSEFRAFYGSFLPLVTAKNEVYIVRNKHCWFNGTSNGWKGQWPPNNHFACIKMLFLLLLHIFGENTQRIFVQRILTRGKYSFKETKGKIKNGINSFSFPLNHYYILLVFFLFFPPFLCLAMCDYALPR